MLGKTVILGEGPTNESPIRKDVSYDKPEEPAEGTKLTGPPSEAELLRPGLG